MAAKLPMAGEAIGSLINLTEKDSFIHSVILLYSQGFILFRFSSPKVLMVLYRIHADNSQRYNSSPTLPLDSRFTSPVVYLTSLYQTYISN